MTETILVVGSKPIDEQTVIWDLLKADYQVSAIPPAFQVQLGSLPLKCLALFCSLRSPTKL